jgi:FkbM family methyltransferase
MRRLPPLPNDLPQHLRVRFTITRWLTMGLRLAGQRERAIRARYALMRALRRTLERRGSSRLSHPALHEMDRKLDAIVDRDGGFFVEAGGHDGYTQSNTYYLERFRGWRGVLVEPMAEMAAEARRNRPASHVFQCALVALDHPGGEVEMEFGDLFSTVMEGRPDDAGSWVSNGLVLGWRDHRVELVPARALSQLLDELGVSEIDLLSLDVEGYEPQALRGLDFPRHAPAWILVEMHDLRTGREAIGEVLGDRYVEHDLLSPLDVLYRRADVGAPSPS